MAIENPGTRPARKGTNWEKWGWIYMRVSGVLLLVLVFGHLFSNLMIGDGVHAIDFGFVGGKLSQPFWKIWDTLLLWLALIHGANGMRTIVNDYVERPGLAKTFKVLLFLSAALLILLGTFVIYTLDPCPAGADPALVASFCNA
ncbi:succinate dehydrogenase hydrophobic membrane anchor subunit [Leucobacter edaphi]|nr:succinate dehydrogenase hydrophobic membrane anchor subunit [Leucobacter edaphi]